MDTAGYTPAKLTFHQDAFSVRRRAWGSSEPRNLVIPHRWYGEQSSVAPSAEEESTLLNGLNCGTGILGGPIHLISKSQAFQSRWCPKNLATEPLCQDYIVIEMVLQESGDWWVLPPHQDFFSTDGFLVVTQVRNHMTLDVFTFNCSIPALGDVASEKLFFLMHS